MTIAVADLLALDEPADFQRDHYDRPLIVPADGGAPVAYTRCSSAAKTIDDTYQLELWNRRNVAYGVAHDQSLAARLLALGGTPYTWEKEQKSAVNKIVEDALQAAQAHKGADIGTAVHKLTERLDRGEDVQAGPYAADLDAYRRALAEGGFSTSAEWIECRMVCDDLQMAGTADRILTRGDEHFIADIKTGSIDYGGLGWAAQLAAYAHGTLYDPTIEKRLDTPPLNRERGVIIHLPAGTGECTLHWIDLRAGYEAALFANRIRAMRSEANGWISPLEVSDPALLDALAASLAIIEGGPIVPLERIEAEGLALRARLNAAVQAGARRMVWPTGVEKFKDGGPVTWSQLLEVERCVLDAEREAGLPFAEPLPADPTPRPNLTVVPPIAGGGTGPSSARPVAGSLDALKAMHEALPSDLQQAAYGLVIAAGVSSDRRTWTQDELPTIERILDAATAEHGKRKAHTASVLAELEDEIVLVLVREATDTPTQAKNLGATLESLTGDEAERLEVLVDALGSSLGISLDAPDEMRLVVGDLAQQHVLDAFGGSKAEALAAAKELATLHGRPKPRSVAGATSDPVLVALLLAAS